MKETEKNNPEVALKAYESLVNGLSVMSASELTETIDLIDHTDITGQYLASSVRYLNAIDAAQYADIIRRMVSAVIDRDREHRYIADLLVALYGDNYAQRADELSDIDDNFRRLYKRIRSSASI